MTDERGAWVGDKVCVREHETASVGPLVRLTLTACDGSDEYDTSAYLTPEEARALIRALEPFASKELPPSGGAG